ncbi:DNA-directed RNA polymerase subunit P [Candidatus Marsarchaeota archaeon]|jgi:DNA-directed RNA polymerase, subunit RPC10 (contains C4-type Zn-finger)|nr:DNA-directed RNA polymerase subunit P [Candidatus Marsarchaeota archaeon]MCL5090004.1 DNA-directed RNA polymerase subunit P [Candidatus Marsarchaeota archaeon]
MTYVCAQCKKKLAQEEGALRCPYCGSRIFVKERPNIPREVSTD